VDYNDRVSDGSVLCYLVLGNVKEPADARIKSLPALLHEIPKSREQPEVGGATVEQCASEDGAFSIFTWQRTQR
jgi:hypothetical protein